MADKNLLTIAETAELLACSAGFVRKKISLTVANQPGGWPTTVFCNLQPNGAKSLFRVNRTALEAYLNTSNDETKSTAVTEASISDDGGCATGNCPV